MQQDPKTGKWIVRWRDAGRHRSQSFTLKRDAEHFAREQKRARELGSLFAPARGAETLAEVVERWWAEHVVRLAPLTRDGYLPVWGKHIRPALGGLRIRELTPGRVDGFRVQLESAGVGAPTVSKALAILSGVCRFAVLRGLIDANPVREVRKPSVRRQRFAAPPAPFAVERVRAELVHAGRFHDAALVSVLAYAGLRPGEALALRWGDVRPRSILVERAAAKGIVKSTKNHRLRSVRLVRPLALDLTWWRVVSDWRGLDDYLFPSSRGELRDRYGWDNWRDRVFKPAVLRAGVPIARPYDLRHAFASLLIHEGRSLTDVAAQLGDSVTTTADVYTHVFAEVDEMLREPATDSIEAARERAGVRQMYVEAGLFDAAEARNAALQLEADGETRTPDPFITSETSLWLIIKRLAQPPGTAYVSGGRDRSASVSWCVIGVSPSQGISQSPTA